MEPSQKWPLVARAAILLPPLPINIFYIITPEQNMIIQNRWCLHLCFDGQGFHWYHIQHHNLFRWIINGQFRDVVRWCAVFFRTFLTFSKRYETWYTCTVWDPEHCQIWSHHKKHPLVAMATILISAITGSRASYLWTIHTECVMSTTMFWWSRIPLPQVKYLRVLFTSERKGKTEKEISRRIREAGAVLQSLNRTVVKKKRVEP